MITCCYALYVLRKRRTKPFERSRAPSSGLNHIVAAGTAQNTFSPLTYSIYKGIFRRFHILVSKNLFFFDFLPKSKSIRKKKILKNFKMASKNRLVKGEIRAHCWSPDRDRRTLYLKNLATISNVYFSFKTELWSRLMIRL